jgi:hypothetical protein
VPGTALTEHSCTKCNSLATQKLELVISIEAKWLTIGCFSAIIWLMIDPCTNRQPKAPFWGLNLVHKNNNSIFKHNITA